MFVPIGRSVSPAVKSARYQTYVDCEDVQENEPAKLKPHRARARRPLSELSCNQPPLMETNTTTFKPEKTVSSNTPSTKPKCISSSSQSTPGRAYVSRRNERERNRVKLLNMGFERLQAVVPTHAGEQLSKISTLRKAIWYIEHLDQVLHGQDKTTMDESAVNASSSRIQNTKLQQKDNPTDSNRTTRTLPHGGSGVASGLASWSVPENTTKPKRSTGGRPVKRQPLSPVFPPHWGNNGLSEPTSASTPRTSEHCTKFPRFELATPKQLGSQQESGFCSMGTPSHLITPKTTATTLLPQQHLLASLESFSNLFPYYTDMLNLPNTGVLNLSQVPSRWSYKRT